MTLYLFVFLALATLFLSRVAVARRVPHARLSWLASGAGAVAILTLGPVVPVRAIDSALWGGQNIVYLIQCWLATLAFWLFAHAALVHDTHETIRPKPWAILLWCVVFSAPFFLISHRAPTEELFIRDHVDQLAAVLCASLYMVGIAFISFRLIVGTARKRDPLYWFFRVSAILVIAAIATQIAALLLNHFQTADVGALRVLYAAFNPLFYLGVIGIGAGMGCFSVARRLRGRRITRRIAELSAILSARNITVPDNSATERAWVIYTLLVGITDTVIIGHLVLSADESRVVAESEEWIEAQLPQLVVSSA